MSAEKLFLLSQQLPTQPSQHEIDLAIDATRPAETIMDDDNFHRFRLTMKCAYTKEQLVSYIESKRIPLFESAKHNTLLATNYERWCAHEDGAEYEEDDAGVVAEAPGKDADENASQITKCIDIVKKAGVSADTERCKSCNS